ncbi:hypothetical protein [Streptosporangium roseum]|uniref:Uncharacterized protein n=1 Tax=Streptosporangium roseum (strain ATCC 12428 / DSM 43021 / JCM 3005 / KCTC 9067 / NCIMB 10171 / NRRL 2505 / NI 9100) TaxID=479432 RepID=D2B766_STRRD|nr:hypothetical protein [Streptosporangium roseum]ACZ89591.1 hypothetical protein Sros_6888 [Streptosporangium roseum DSM 43021]
MALLYNHYNAEGTSKQEETTLSFTSPSQGDTFDFSVTVRLSRISGAKRRGFTPWGFSAELKEQAREIIRSTVRSATRQYPILEPDRAEKAVNLCLDRELSHPSPLLPGWRAQAELALPDEVKEPRRRHLNAMFEIEARATETERQMKTLRESRAACERFLSEAMDSWMARYAIQLGEDPQNAAVILQDMLNERRDNARDLLDLLGKIVAAQTSANVYDLVIASESALRKSFERLGVPLPPPDPESLFAPVGDSV